MIGRRGAEDRERGNCRLQGLRDRMGTWHVRASSAERVTSGKVEAGGAAGGGQGAESEFEVGAGQAQAHARAGDHQPWGAGIGAARGTGGVVASKPAALPGVAR
jgi:hypothetical protein